MVNSTNSTFEEEKPNYMMIPYINSITISLAVIFLAGITLNLISIIVILNEKKKLQPIKILILNLALADIIYTLGIPLFVSNVFNHNW
jgi:hypothetical protein